MSSHRNANKGCSLKWNNQHIVTHILYDKFPWVVAEKSEMFAFKARAYVNIVGIILLMYVCVYVCMYVCMYVCRYTTITSVNQGHKLNGNIWYVIPVRMFHGIVLHPNISSVEGVTLYWVTSSFLHNCCLLIRSAMMVLHTTECKKYCSTSFYFSTASNLNRQIVTSKYYKKKKYYIIFMGAWCLKPQHIYWSMPQYFMTSELLLTFCSITGFPGVDRYIILRGWPIS